jgi:hypothetical protein
VRGCREVGEGRWGVGVEEEEEEEQMPLPHSPPLCLENLQMPWLIIELKFRIIYNILTL